MPLKQLYPYKELTLLKATGMGDGEVKDGVPLTNLLSLISKWGLSTCRRPGLKDKLRNVQYAVAQCRQVLAPKKKIVSHRHHHHPQSFLPWGLTSLQAFSLYSAPHNFLVPLCSLAFTTVCFQNISQVQVTSSLHLHCRGEQCCQFLSCRETGQWALWAPHSTTLCHSSQWGKPDGARRTGEPEQEGDLQLRCNESPSASTGISKEVHAALSLMSTQSRAMTEIQGVKPWEETKSLWHTCLPTDLEGS